MQLNETCPNSYVCLSACFFMWESVHPSSLNGVEHQTISPQGPGTQLSTRTAGESVKMWECENVRICSTSLMGVAHQAICPQGPGTQLSTRSAGQYTTSLNRRFSLQLLLSLNLQSCHRWEKHVFALSKAFLYKKKYCSVRATYLFFYKLQLP